MRFVGVIMAIAAAEPELIEAEVLEPVYTAEEMSEKLLFEETAIQEGCKAFYYDVGAALRRIRDGQLYLARDYGSFEDYIEANRDRLGFGSRGHAYRLIDATIVADNLRSLSPTGDVLLPASERQIRMLKALPPEQQVEVWQEVITQPDSGDIPQRLAELVEERRAKQAPKRGADPEVEKKVETTLKKLLPKGTVEEKIQALNDVKELNFKGNATIAAMVEAFPVKKRTAELPKQIQLACTSLRRNLEAQLPKGWWVELKDGRKTKILAVVIKEGDEEVELGPEQVARFVLA
jgi:hypothetical protein